MNTKDYPFPVRGSQADHLGADPEHHGAPRLSEGRADRHLQVDRGNLAAGDCVAEPLGPGGPEPAGARAPTLDRSDLTASEEPPHPHEAQSAPCRDLRRGAGRGALPGPSRSRRPRIPLLCLLLPPGDHPRACSAWRRRPRSSLSGRSTPISTPIRSPAARFRATVAPAESLAAYVIVTLNPASRFPGDAGTALPRCPGGGGSPRDRSGVPAVPVPRDPVSPRLLPARGSRRGGERHDPRPLGRCSPCACAPAVEAESQA